MSAEPNAQEMRAAAAHLHSISDEELADRVRACHKVARWLISQATKRDLRNNAARKKVPTDA